MAVAIKAGAGETITLAHLAAHHRIAVADVRTAVVKRKVPVKHSRIDARDQGDVYFGALAERRVRMYCPVAANGDPLNIGDDVIIEGGEAATVIDVDDDDGRVYVAVAVGGEVEKLAAAQRRMDGPAVCDEIEQSKTPTTEA